MNAHLHRGRAAVVAALSLALIGGATMPAYADDPVTYDETTDNSGFAYHLNPANEINGGAYTVTWNPTERTDDGATSGSPAGKFGPAGITTSTGCPEGYRASSRTFIVTPDGLETSAALQRTQATSPYFGLQGSAMTLSSTRAASWISMTDTTNPNGVNALVITCDPPINGGYPGNAKPIGNAKYFVTFFSMDWATNHWEVTTDPRGATKTATTTELASSNVTQTSATLTATVAPGDATGTVQFTQGGTAIGSPVPVAGGTATYSVSGLTAGTTYAFTAEYSGDATYAASTGAVSVTTEAIPVQDSSDSSVGVAVPTATTPAPTGLKMSAKPGAVTLTGPTTRTAGEVWTATGELGTVTVNDDRQSAGTPWTLNGRISKLTSGSNEIAASNVGWKPAKVGDGNGTAGAEVAASVDGGLGSDKPLATGTGSATANVTTSVGATITLNTPADAPAGDYTATLTLTLI